ncbi:hypothetical protein CHUV0807_0399 [Cardiobacterium hominis]|uniref:MORN repeat protein n=1 Tax=Cardiobacterium hominis TaxID=2718 RepID=A0A1C3H2E7_9GAMM|nr:toxin-antitoxin system YwqK family antitoxin [Cardiobacterium hominis]SAM58172.1 hypothetical protein CHUV0807_0399 [Cardiobacterium hominis]
MTKQTTILTLLLALASPAALACTPGVGGGPAGDPQCMYPIFQQNSLYNNSNNTYVEPAPVYVRPPSPPPTHHCTARAEGGEICADTRPGRIGSSYSTNAAGDFDGPMVDSYPDGTPQSITNFHNGEVVGESTQYYPDGTIESVMHHQNGEIHGSVRHYHPNGTLKHDMTYCNGEACGEERDYDEQGNLVRIIRFDANGDAESVEEVSPGRKPRKKS